MPDIQADRSLRPQRSVVSRMLSTPLGRLMVGVSLACLLVDFLDLTVLRTAPSIVRSVLCDLKPLADVALPNAFARYLAASCGAELSEPGISILLFLLKLIFVVTALALTVYQVSRDLIRDPPRKDKVSPERVRHGYTGIKAWSIAVTVFVICPMYVWLNWFSQSPEQYRTTVLAKQHEDLVLLAVFVAGIVICTVIVELLLKLMRTGAHATPE